MNNSLIASHRILVVARPTVGRVVEAILTQAGYEVHRTPGDDDLIWLVARLRPQAVIAAVDIPWLDLLDSMRPLFDGPRPIPVLLLGETSDADGLSHMPQLPLPVDAMSLLREVRCLLATQGADTG